MVERLLVGCPLVAVCALPRMLLSGGGRAAGGAADLKERQDAIKVLAKKNEALTKKNEALNKKDEAYRQRLLEQISDAERMTLQQMIVDNRRQMERNDNQLKLNRDLLDAGLKDHFAG